MAYGTYAAQTIDARVYGVVQVSMLIRHGARMPTRYIVDAWSDRTLDSEALTPNGMVMMFVLGKRIRDMYPEILSDNLTEDQANIYSAPAGRCHQSAISFLLGLFPGQFDDQNSVYTNANSQNSISNSLKQDETTESSPNFLKNTKIPHPFSLKIEKFETDTLFEATKSSVCPRAFQTLSPILDSAILKYEHIYDKLSVDLAIAGFEAIDTVGTEKYSFTQLSTIADQLKCYKNKHGMLPSGISQDLFARLVLFYNFYNDLWFMLSDKYTRLIANRMARAITSTIEDKVSGGNVSFNLWSGHDNNIHAFSALFGLVDLKCSSDALISNTADNTCVKFPAYGASYIFELSVKHGQHFVRVMLDGRPITICSVYHDEHYCAWQMFKKEFADMVYYREDDIKEYCGNDGIDEDGYPKESQGADLWMIYVMMLTLIMAAALYGVRYAVKYTKAIVSSSLYAE